jgi:hypothetical protein
MGKVPLSLTVALAVATTLGFIGGYVVHSRLGTELPAARQALIESQTGQRVLDAYKEIIQAKAMYDVLATVNSVEQVQLLKSRSKAGVLATIDHFVEIAKDATDPRERLLAQQFLPLANETRVRIETSPSPSSASSTQ